MRLLIHDYSGHPFQVQLSRELARRGHSVIHAYAARLLTPRDSLQRKFNDPIEFEVIEVPMDVNYRRDKYRFLRRRGMELDYGLRVAELIERKKPEIVVTAMSLANHSLEGGWVYTGQPCAQVRRRWAAHYDTTII